MKSLIFILSFLFCFASSFSQVITTNTPGGTPRSNKSVKEVEDFNLGARTNFFVPRFVDTTSANQNATMDTCGRLCFTYDVDNFWIRRCTPSKHWEQLGTGSGTAILPQCGILNNTGIVTWDSLLVFDITASVYALCCDHVARTTPDTTIVLPPANDSLPRIDAIILTANGIEIDTGVAAANPAIPQLDSCELLLTYVLINAGQTVPAFVSANNPLIIYDEFAPTEWDSLKYVNTEADSANTQFPIHLTRALHVWNFAQDGSGLFEFHTDSTINLNDYGALKFYIRDSTPITLFITWYLDNVPQTASLQAPISPAVINGYQTIVIPITDWTFVGTSSQVNTIRFSIEPVPDNSKGFFVDWIQLQSGIPAPASPLGVTSVNVGSLPPLFTGTVVNPTTNPLILFTQQTAAAYTVFQNDNNTAQFPSFGKLSLTNTVKDSLAIANIQGGPDGSYLNTNGGVKQWVVPGADTILVQNWLRLHPDGNGNDTLTFGDRVRDSSKLAFDTYVSLNSHFVDFNQGATDLFKLSSNGTNGTATLGGSRFELTSGANILAANNLTLGSDGNVFTVTGNTQINAITTANWQSGSNVQLIFTGAPTVKNNTAGGAGTAKILLAGGVDYTAAANDVLTLVYDGTNWHETSRKTSGTVTSQTLQQVFNTEVGGSVMTKNDSILTGSNSLRIITTSGTPTTLLIQATGGGVNSTTTSTTASALQGLASSNGNGVFGIANGTGFGVFGRSGGSGWAAKFQRNGGTGYGVNIEPDLDVNGTISQTGLYISNFAPRNPTTLLQVEGSKSSDTVDYIMSSFRRNYTTNNNTGSSIGYDQWIVNSANNIVQVSKQLFRIVDNTATTESSSNEFYSLFGGVMNNNFTINGNGSVQFRPITSTAASAITPAEGMMLFVSNTNVTFTSIGFWGYQNGAWHAF